MGKILQKKKARSGLSKAKAKNNRLKSGNKKINVLGNAIIAQNWYAGKLTSKKKKVVIICANIIFTLGTVI